MRGAAVVAVAVHAEVRGVVSPAAKARGKAPARRYTDEQIHEALQWATYFHSAQKASDLLAERGDRIPAATILAWRRKHPAILEQCLTQLDNARAERGELIVDTATELELKVLGRINDRIDEIEAKDLAGTLRNISTTKGITFERIVGPIRGRPNVVIEHREPTKLLEEMARIAEMVRPSVDSSAVEITDAEEVEA